MLTTMLLKIAWHPGSYIFLMDINVIFVSPGSICPSRALLGSRGNAILNSVDGCIQLLLDSPTVIGDLIPVVFHESIMV